jgi:hypothetical protein
VGLSVGARKPSEILFYSFGERSKQSRAENYRPGPGKVLRTICDPKKKLCVQKYNFELEREFGNSGFINALKTSRLRFWITLPKSWNWTEPVQFSGLCGSNFFWMRQSRFFFGVYIRLAGFWSGFNIFLFLFLFQYLCADGSKFKIWAKFIEYISRKLFNVSSSFCQLNFEKFLKNSNRPI